MKAVFYCNKKTGRSPVKEYLSQYEKNSKDSTKDATRKAKILAGITARVNHLVDVNGVSKNLLKPLAGYCFNQMGSKKNSNILIRILCMRCGDLFLLLHIFEKPDDYKGTKMTNKINKEYEIAEKRRKDFNKNPQSYEDYNH